MWLAGKGFYGASSHEGVVELSRKSNNLKKRLRQRDVELGIARGRILRLEKDLAEEKKRANIRDGIVSIVINREHELPGELWAFKVIVDKDAVDSLIWKSQDNHLRQNMFTEMLEKMVVSNLRKLVKDIVYKEI